MKTVAEYREFAERCRELAAVLSNPKDRQALELMASSWDKAAEQREALLQSENNKSHH